MGKDAFPGDIRAKAEAIERARRRKKVAFVAALTGFFKKSVRLQPFADRELIFPSSSMTRTFTCGIVSSGVSATKNLYHGAATRVATALDDLAFDFAGDHKLQSSQLFAKTSQGHQQFG